MFDFFVIEIYFLIFGHREQLRRLDFLFLRRLFVSQSFFKHFEKRDLSTSRAYIF